MTQREMSLIRFVTARQAHLRGLHELAFAGYAAAICTLAPYCGDLLRALLQRGLAMVLAALVLVQLFTLLFVRIDRAIARHYDSTLGRVGYAHAPRIAGVGRSLLAVGAALDLTPWFPLAGHSAFPLALALYGSWVAIRDRPWRGYYAAMIGVAIWAPVVMAPSTLAGYLPAYITGLIALGVGGLLDHLLLVRSMARLRRRPARSPA